MLSLNRKNVKAIHLMDPYYCALISDTPTKSAIS